MADPSTISGLVARYRADSITGVANGGTVASWPDTSASAVAATSELGTATLRTAAGAVALPNGRPYVEFANSSTSFRFDNSAVAGPFTIFAIGNLSSFGSNNILALVGGANARTALLGARADGSGVYFGSDNEAAFLTANATIQTQKWRIYGGLYANTGAAQVFLDGTRIASGTSSTYAPQSALRLGNSSLTKGWIGGIAELLIFNRVLTTAEVATVDSYAQDRYGITVADYTPDTRQVAYAGGGTLTAAGQAVTAGTAAYTGTGQLTGASSPAVAVSAGYGGTGTLTAASTPATGSTVAYSGAGTLTAAAAPAVSSAATYTGSGALASTAAPALAAPVVYSGTGALTSSGRLSLTTPIAYTGAGTLTAAALPGAASPAAYAGAGTLTLAVTTSIGRQRWGSQPVRAIWWGTRRVRRIGYGLQLTGA